MNQEFEAKVATIHESARDIAVKSSDEFFDAFLIIIDKGCTCVTTAEMFAVVMSFINQYFHLVEQGDGGRMGMTNVRKFVESILKFCGNTMNDLRSIRTKSSDDADSVRNLAIGLTMEAQGRMRRFLGQ